MKRFAKVVTLMVALACATTFGAAIQPAEAHCHHHHWNNGWNNGWNNNQNWRRHQCNSYYGNGYNNNPYYNNANMYGNGYYQPSMMTRMFGRL